MQVLDFRMNDDLLFAAYGFSNFRENVKKYLEKNKMCYDKFTVTENDSFLGYLSEYSIKNYIKRKFISNGIIVSSWGDNYDIKKINNIVNNNSNKKEDLLYVKEYFYDKYDLKIEYNNNYIFLDIKTAETTYEPKDTWNFLYPVIQTKKDGKDFVVLNYYVKNSKNITDFKKFVLVGYMSENDVKKYDIQSAGTKTEKGTLSQIDNLKTYVKDYKKFDNLIYSLLLEK